MFLIRNSFAMTCNKTSKLLICAVVGLQFLITGICHAVAHSPAIGDEPSIHDFAPLEDDPETIQDLENTAKSSVAQELVQKHIENFNEGQYNATEQREKQEELLSGDKEKLNTGTFQNKATIIILNVRTGKKKQMTLIQNQKSVYKNLRITLHSCWKEQNNVYNPESKALMEIYDVKNAKQIFYGWILKNHRALSQPIYQDYFFFLNG